MNDQIRRDAFLARAKEHRAQERIAHNGNDHRQGPLPNCFGCVFDFLLAELEQAEQGIVGAKTISSLKSQARLAKVPPLIEAANELLAYHRDADYPNRSTDRMLQVENALAAALAAWESE
jgi:hypothetical protein